MHGDDAQVSRMTFQAQITPSFMQATHVLLDGATLGGMAATASPYANFLTWDNPDFQSIMLHEILGYNGETVATEQLGKCKVVRCSVDQPSGRKYTQELIHTSLHSEQFGVINTWCRPCVMEGCETVADKLLGDRLVPIHMIG